MKLDAFHTSLPIERAGGYARSLEAAGFYGLWVAETQTDPLLSLAAASPRIESLARREGLVQADPTQTTYVRIRPDSR